MQKRLKRFSLYSATTAAAYTMHDGQSSQKVGRRGPEKICKYLITTTTICKRRTTKNVFYTSSLPCSVFRFISLLNIKRYKMYTPECGRDKQKVSPPQLASGFCFQSLSQILYRARVSAKTLPLTYWDNKNIFPNVLDIQFYGYFHQHVFA